LSAPEDAAQLRGIPSNARADFLQKGWWTMLRGGCLVAVLGIGLLAAGAARGQAQFGPIQPFAGAPTPVYVAAPYAAPTALAPLGGPAVYGVAPPQIQLPAASVPPAILAPGGSACPPAVAPGCGAAPSYRLPLPAPATSYSPTAPALPPGAVVLGTGLYGQPTPYIAGQPVRNYVRYLSP
jgi:hypothetical protein